MRDDSQYNGSRNDVAWQSGDIDARELSKSSCPAPRADIVVPVYNALEHTRLCLESLLAAPDSAWSRIIVVNDGSDAETSEYLRAVARSHPAIQLVEHPANRGYTAAVNSGLRASTAPYVVLLNSDTIVPALWLDRLLRCAATSPRIGIVGPMSNAATWQSLPRVRGADGRFAVNTLPPGWSVDEMADCVACQSSCTYPRVPVVNGFCFLISRAVIDAIGLMDEEAFPVGYGEENDYCVRATNAGFEIVVADDAYVYHAKSKSFGHAQRTSLSRAGMKALRAKHGDARIDDLIERSRDVAELNLLRARVDRALAEEPDMTVRCDPMTLRVLFLLPVKGGSGGANSVVQEAVGMRRLGVHVKIAVRAQDHARLCRFYQDVGDATDLFVPIDQADLLDVARGYDVAIATIYKSVEDLARIASAYPELLPAYYVQDYEPLFFEEGSADRQRALRSYERIPNALLFAKTRWIAEQVARFHGVHVREVEPSIDHDVYFPMARKERDHVRIVAMVRPQTPRRGAFRTMRVLREVVRRHPGRVAVHVFGCPTDDPRFQELPLDFPFVNYGELVRKEVASLLRQSDVFVDLSDYQAFGRTGLEAMASGCVAVLPVHGGTDEYARDAENAVVVDSLDEAACVERISELVASPDARQRLRRAGLATASSYNIHRAAVSELLVLADALESHRARADAADRRPLALLPARSSSGELTARARARLLAPWRTPAVRRRWDVEVIAAGTLPDPERAGVAIVQRGSTGPDVAAICEWLEVWRARGGKLAFDADDDVLDADALRAADGTDGGEQPSHDEWLASIADAVLVSTEEQERVLRGVNPTVLRIAPRLDVDLWGIAEGGRRSAGTAFPRAGVVRIGYLGDPLHPDDLDACAEALRRIERERAGRVEIEVIGAFQHGPVLFGRRVGLPKNRVYPDYVRWLRERATWDIGIIPPPSRDDGRSSRRFLEYSALGLATICAQRHPAARVIRDGCTGLLVENTPDAWYRALQRLIEDGAVRGSLASSALAELVRSEGSTPDAPDCHEAIEVILRLPRRLDIPLPLGGRAPGQTLHVVRTRPGASARRSNEPKAAERPMATRSSFATGPRDEPISKARRKFDKLVREPERFFADSRSPLVRALGRAMRWSR